MGFISTITIRWWYQKVTIRAFSSQQQIGIFKNKFHKKIRLIINFIKFQVILDVQQFTPEEITVKAANNSVVVEGRHEEKQDEHGFISRQFTRRYILPGGYDVQDLVSTLSSDGVLTITAPKRPPPNAGERIVPITKTGPAKQPEPVSTSQQQPREQTVPIVTSP